MPARASSIARLEAFSDGVIAVIITIMVLELKVPHDEGTSGLAAIVPNLLVYLLSFAFTGIYWINHQHLVERIESAGRFTLYANLAFLFCLSLLPFFTNYVIEKRLDSFTVALYAVSMIVTALSFFLLRAAVHRELVRMGSLSKEDTAERGKHIASLALYLASVPLAYVQAKLALLIVAFVTVLWIIPNFATRRSR